MPYTPKPDDRDTSEGLTPDKAKRRPDNPAPRKMEPVR